MTRETRIALLVGLAFIVLFGLVLGQRSRSLGTAAGPGAPAPGTSPLPEAAGPEMVTASMDALADRLALQPQPVHDRSGGQAPPRPEAARTAHLVARQPPGPEPPPAAPPRQEVPIHPVGADSAEPARPARPVRPEPPPVRTYKVVPGDTLIKIARKMYGREHEQEYLRIYRANQNRLRDPSRLQIGQVLVIPPDEIARRQMGDGSHQAVRKLLEANPDRIADPDCLPVGLQLRIPNGA